MEINLTGPLEIRLDTGDFHRKYKGILINFVGRINQFMKIYEFRCESCGSIFELTKEESEDLSCPRCGSKDVKRLFSTPAIMKDYALSEGKTCCGRDERCSTPPCGDNGACVR